jgi:HNH endonuclease
LIFDYPDPRTQRRHAPAGYAAYDSYRPWLRDEFTFRCVYCLIREQWGRRSGDFDIDHFQPQRLRPDLHADYSNLVYACRHCNGVKQGQEIDDPFVTMNGTQVRARPDGTVEGVNAAATRVILALDLNSPQLVRMRIMWMRIVELASESDEELLKQLTGFPEENDLPDLRRLKPPGGNARPEGIAESWRARRERGELPDHY